jgi:hypothetical protein
VHPKNHPGTRVRELRRTPVVVRTRELPHRYPDDRVPRATQTSMAGT